MTKIINKTKNSENDERCIKALKELKCLKVNEVRNNDSKTFNNFSDDWWDVLHEVDMCDEGEETELNANTAESARKWIEKYKVLYEEYNYC